MDAHKELLTQAYKEMGPLLEKLLADITAPSIHEKILSADLPGKHYRGKRDVSEVSEPTLIRHKRQLPDFMMAYMNPVVANVINELSSAVAGDADSIISKVVIPLAYDILNNPESMWDVFQVIVIAKASFSPLIWEMMKRQTYNAPQGTVVKVPRHFYEQADRSFQRARPIVNKLMNNYTEQVLRYAHDASPQLVDLFDNLIYENYAGVNTLKDEVFDFLQKHRDMFKTSTDAQVHYYSMAEIQRDFAPIKTALINLFFAYVRRNPKSLMNITFGENGLLHRLFVSLSSVGNPNSRPVNQVANPKPVSRVAIPRPVVRAAKPRPVARVANTRPVRVYRPVRVNRG